MIVDSGSASEPPAARPDTETPAESSTSGPSSHDKIYRLRKGTKVADLPPRPPNPPVPDLASLNGPFQLAEYLALLVRHDPHDTDRLVNVPSEDDQHASGGEAAEKDVWIYEHLRRLPIDLTPLITSLLPICNRETCPQMKAGEWLYLCVAHGSGGTEECCAIDYVLHTLDSTTALLNSSKSFPSRLSIPSSSLRHFPALFRRLSRIFSHAYFHHLEAFQLAEAETGLYARFLALSEHFQLVERNLLVIPSDALDKTPDEHEERDSDEDDDEPSEDEDDRGRDPDRQDSTAVKRPHSLGRHPSPAAIEKPLPTAAPDEPSPNPRPRNAVGTLSRGSRGRGALWPIPSASPSSPSLTTEISTQSAMEASPTKRPIARNSISPRASAKDAAVIVPSPDPEPPWPRIKSSESTGSIVKLSDVENSDNSSSQPQDSSPPKAKPTSSDDPTTETTATDQSSAEDTQPPESKQQADQHQDVPDHGEKVDDEAVDPAESKTTSNVVSEDDAPGADAGEHVNEANKADA